MQDDSLEENLRLAQEYQKLQNTFLMEKDNYFNLYDRQLSLDASIRDKKQVGFLISLNNDLLDICTTKSNKWAVMGSPIDGGPLYAAKWHVSFL